MLQNPLLINKTILKSDFLDEDIINMSDKTFVIPSSFSYNVIHITDDFIGRMDLVSHQVYGDADYADILCKLNGISNPFELNADCDIIVPSINDITQFYYKESESETDDESREYSKKAPVAKKKTDKRAPNEAVVGDKRYKVDSTRKVIIY